MYLRLKDSPKLICSVYITDITFFHFSRHQFKMFSASIVFALTCWIICSVHVDVFVLGVSKYYAKELNQWTYFVLCSLRLLMGKLKPSTPSQNLCDSRIVIWSNIAIKNLFSVLAEKAFWIFQGINLQNYSLFKLTSCPPFLIIFGVHVSYWSSELYFNFYLNASLISLNLWCWRPN